jgi:hypothetical protein
MMISTNVLLVFIWAYLPEFKGAQAYLLGLESPSSPICKNHMIIHRAWNSLKPGTPEPID